MVRKTVQVVLAKCMDVIRLFVYCYDLLISGISVIRHQAHSSEPVKVSITL